MEIGSPLSPEDEAADGTVLGSAVQVHRQLGPGLLERFYRRALCVELEAWGVSYEVEHPVRIHYPERVLGVHRLDLLVERRVIVEVEIGSTARVCSYGAGTVISESSGVARGTVAQLLCSAAGNPPYRPVALMRLATARHGRRLRSRAGCGGKDENH